MTTTMEARLENEKLWLTNIIKTKLVKTPQFLKHYDNDQVDSFKINDINIKIIGTEEAFMLTMCYRASLIFEYMNTVHIRSLVIKKTPEIPQEMYDDINFDALFNNEIQSYTNIFSKIGEIAGQNFNLTKFYYGETGKNFAFIILDDFSPNGWSVAKDRTNLQLGHVLCTVKYLAQFHACGFAMRHTQRRDFDMLNSLLKESRYAKSTISHELYDLSVVTSGTRLVDATQKYQPTIPLQFTQRLCNMQKKTFKYNKDRVAPVEPMITFCHGDFLRNNIAYKYSDGKCENPCDVMMFDLQTVRIGSPMIDLTIYLGLSVFTEVRHTYFTEIFKLYCEELTTAYKLYTQSENCPTYLNYEALIKEYTRLLPYSISTAVAFLPTLVEPHTESIEELLTQERTQEEVKLEAMTRGGIIVDKEVSHQVKELYYLMNKYDVDIFAGCDY